VTGVPNWLAATPNQPPQAGQVNQFLGAHPTTYLYQGTLKDNQQTAGSGAVTSNGTYIAQKFTTAIGQTAVGLAAVVLAAPGTPGATLPVSIYASSGGAPTGSPLLTANVAPEYANFAPSFVTIPLPLAGLTASTAYFLVTGPAGPNGTNCFSWSKSNQVTGAYTSTNGTTWTAQAYGMRFEIFDQSVTGPLTCTWEDAGARWTWLGYNASNQMNALSEYTAAQNAGYLQANRTLTYSGTSLIGVA
jgi:hypothetical protein